LEEAYCALTLGIREYARKNSFRGAVLGLSGGIDSALTAALAVDALGPKSVTAVIMSSRFTSRASVEDAAQVGRRLGLRMLVLPIERIYGAYAATLGKHLLGPRADLARQNLQARIRGALLMALSNRYGCLVLATGNKSEMSVGYATLYGDMAGGFAPLKDVPKTLVYKLALWRTRRGRKPAIPSRIFNKAPTAELKPNQKDSDSLPPYAVLDPILHGYLEHFLSVPELIKAGHPKAQVHKTAQMVERSEYKRRQAPPGVKITGRVLGRDRRVPISHAFKSWGRS
jgi:NAD+ synthase (glutamine-hydrolysing)